MRECPYTYFVSAKIAKISRAIFGVVSEEGGYFDVARSVGVDSLTPFMCAKAKPCLMETLFRP